jgi:flagellar basal body-associated protein FliL
MTGGAFPAQTGIDQAMTDNLNSTTSGESANGKPIGSKWVKVTTIAAVSALAGGIAAAWFYRNTLRKLQHAGAEAENSNFGITTTRSGDDD